MNCRRARHLLFDFIDGMENETLRAGLDRHLGECPECETFAAQMTKSLSLVRRVPMETLDENFNWKVRLAIHRERNVIRAAGASVGSWARAWNLRYAAGAAVAFAAVLVVGVSLDRRGLVPPAPVTVFEPGTNRRVAAGDTETSAKPATPTVTQHRPVRSTSMFVSSEPARPGLSGAAGTPGAIDDAARSEATIDSLVEYQLMRLTPEERERVSERLIHRLESRRQSQQARPVRP